MKTVAMMAAPQCAIWSFFRNRDPVIVRPRSQRRAWKTRLPATRRSFFGPSMTAYIDDESPRRFKRGRHPRKHVQRVKVHDGQYQGLV